MVEAARPLLTVQVAIAVTLHLVCRLLSGRAELPPEPEMEAAVAAHYKWLQEVGRPLRYSHMMDEVGGQWAEWLTHCWWCFNTLQMHDRDFVAVSWLGNC